MLAKWLFSVQSWIAPTDSQKALLWSAFAIVWHLLVWSVIIVIVSILLMGVLVGIGELINKLKKGSR